jgi:hypothetical protein
MSTGYFSQYGALTDAEIERWRGRPRPDVSTQREQEAWHAANFDHPDYEFLRIHSYTREEWAEHKAHLERLAQRRLEREERAEQAAIRREEREAAEAAEREPAPSVWGEPLPSAEDVERINARKAVRFGDVPPPEAHPELRY